MTLGHVDIVTRASRLFDHVVLAVVQNPAKTPLFSAAQRVALARQCVSHLKNVSVEAFDGLTVAFARARQASSLIRGLRALSDFEAEFAMSQMNRTLAPDIETVFLMTSLAHQYVSSSMLKEVAALGADVNALAPAPVIDALAALGSPPPHNG